MQVLQVWQDEAAKQRHHRAILDKCVSRMQHCIRARVMRTWVATAQRMAGARGKAAAYLERLLSRRLKHALRYWRARAIYKRERYSILKVWLVPRACMSFMEMSEATSLPNFVQLYKSKNLQCSISHHLP